MKVSYSELHREIVEDCISGDRKAQFQLYKLYSKAMYSICLRMLGSREEAEDLLQEAFVYAFTKLNTFRFESTFGAWLKQIVVNRCINHLKKKRVSLQYEEDTSKFTLEDTPTVSDEKLNVDHVHHAIGLLPDGYRVILSLYLLEGYDHQEIAQVLEISESTSKSQYHRAKKKVVEILNEMEYEA